MSNYARSSTVDFGRRELSRSLNYVSPLEWIVSSGRGTAKWWVKWGCFIAVVYVVRRLWINWEHNFWEAHVVGLQKHKCPSEHLKTTTMAFMGRKNHQRHQYCIPFQTVGWGPVHPAVLQSRRKQSGCNWTEIEQTVIEKMGGGRASVCSPTAQTKRRLSWTSNSLPSLPRILVSGKINPCDFRHLT